MKNETKVRLESTGPSSEDLQSDAEDVLIRHYNAEKNKEGEFVIDRGLNVIAFNVLMKEIIVVACHHGPDTYFSVLNVDAPAFKFESTNFGQVIP